MVDVVLRDVVAQISQLYGWKIGWGWDKSSGRDLIGGGQVSHRWVKVLESATGQTGFERCTLLALSSRASGELLSSEDRVCLQCLSEDMAGGAIPYGRLLWRLKSVTCCPTHRTLLVSPSCGRESRSQMAQFARVKLAGVCSECGSIGHKCMNVMPQEAAVADIWRAEQCHGLIRSLGAVSKTDPRSVPLAIRSYCSEPGALTSLALRSGATLSVLSRWMNESNARVSFDLLLDICGTERLDLAALMQGCIEKQACGVVTAEPARSKRKVAPVNHEAVKAALAEAVDTGETVTQIATRLRVDIATLAKHRMLYAKVREATRQRQVAAVAARQDEAVRAAEAAAVQLARRNLPITHRNARKVGVGLYLSQVESAILSMIRIGLGDRTISNPPLAARMGEALLQKIDRAVQRIQAAVGAEQLRLPLRYR